MASQIAHIVYAKAFFERLEKGEIVSNLGKIDKDEFFLGAVFPDVRRMDDSIKRKVTHFRFEKLDLDFSGLTSFEAGWKFHLFCDMRREEILNKHDFYTLPHATDFYHHPAKILEDEVVYDKYNNWEKLCYYFNNPPFFESGTGISQETYNLWYAIVAKYMEKKPDEKAMRIFLSKQLKLPASINQIMESVSQLRENQKAVEILEGVSEEILQL